MYWIFRNNGILWGLKNQANLNIFVRSYRKRCVILGIETSCDDTGAAIVDSDRNILGEALRSQQDIVLQYGGIIPRIAQQYHRSNIKPVVYEALENAKLTVNDVDAIAVTVTPGLGWSLLVGMKYAKELSKTFNKPFIPIHHMEAHALTPRMCDETIEYPYLAFLISGAHCLLSIAKSVDKFTLLGQSIDDGVGEAFDKVARRLKLRNILEYRMCAGGAAIEKAALSGNYKGVYFTCPMSKHRNCNFSFSGLKTSVKGYIRKQEEIHDIEGDALIPDYKDLCASFQFVVTEHLCQRLQRAMEYIRLKNLLPEKKTLILSGGSACNLFIQKSISLVCQRYGYSISIPPLKYCTDNGIMIAWNGVEKYLQGISVLPPDEIDLLNLNARSQLGEDMTKDVLKANINCDWINLHELVDPQYLKTPD